MKTTISKTDLLRFALASITVVGLFASAAHAENSFPRDGEEYHWDSIEWSNLNSCIHGAPWQCEHCKSKQSLFVFGAYVDFHYTKPRSGKRGSRRSVVAGIVTDADLQSLPTAEDLFFRRDGTQVVELDTSKRGNGLQAVPKSSRAQRTDWKRPWRRDERGLLIHHGKWTPNSLFVITARCICDRCGRKGSPVQFFTGHMSKTWMTWTRGEYAGISDWAVIPSQTFDRFCESDRSTIPDPVDVWRENDGVFGVVLTRNAKLLPVDQIRSEIEKLKRKE